VDVETRESRAGHSPGNSTPFHLRHKHKAIESENIMKNRIGNLTGTFSRFNAVLSLVLVVVFFASCKGQSGLMNFSPGQTASQPAAITPSDSRFTGGSNNKIDGENADFPAGSFHG
jgi:hypothetical protein